MEPHVPEISLESIDQYLNLLDRWNRIHALTAIAADARFEELIQDSCALLPHLTSLSPGARVADFGTGMGIPAVILALARPEIQVLAVDRTKKKLAFLRQAVLELEIRNLQIVEGSLESLAPLAADAGVAKAFGSLEDLGRWWVCHGRPGAPFFALKGEGWERENKPLGFRVEAHPYHLPSRGRRSVVVLTPEAP